MARPRTLEEEIRLFLPSDRIGKRKGTLIVRALGRATPAGIRTPRNLLGYLRTSNWEITLPGLGEADIELLCKILVARKHRVVMIRKPYGGHGRMRYFIRRIP